MCRVERNLAHLGRRMRSKRESPSHMSFTLHSLLYVLCARGLLAFHVTKVVVVRFAAKKTTCDDGHAKISERQAICCAQSFAWSENSRHAPNAWKIGHPHLSPDERARKRIEAVWCLAVGARCYSGKAVVPCREPRLAMPAFHRFHLMIDCFRPWYFVYAFVQSFLRFTSPRSESTRPGTSGLARVRHRDRAAPQSSSA